MTLNGCSWWMGVAANHRRYGNPLVTCWPRAADHLRVIVSRVRLMTGWYQVIYGISWTFTSRYAISCKNSILQPVWINRRCWLLLCYQCCWYVVVASLLHAASIFSLMAVCVSVWIPVSQYPWDNATLSQPFTWCQLWPSLPVSGQYCQWTNQFSD